METQWFAKLFVLLRCVTNILQAGDMEEFATYFREAKDAGLGITLHIAEVKHTFCKYRHFPF